MNFDDDRVESVFLYYLIGVVSVRELGYLNTDRPFLVFAFRNCLGCYRVVVIAKSQYVTYIGAFHFISKS